MRRFSLRGDTTKANDAGPTSPALATCTVPPSIAHWTWRIVRPVFRTDSSAVWPGLSRSEGGVGAFAAGPDPGVCPVDGLLLGRTRWRTAACLNRV